MFLNRSLAVTSNYTNPSLLIRVQVTKYSRPFPNSECFCNIKSLQFTSIMSGLASAIARVVEEAPGAVAQLLPFLKAAAKEVLIPIFAGIFGTVAVIRVFQTLHRIVHPPNAKELHKEALGCLKKGENKPTVNRAKQLLERSIKKDPHYLPPRLSLAALQLYQEQNHEEATVTIKQAQALFPNNKELDNMELDAKAMKANLGHMVLVGSAATTYLGDYSYRYR